MFVVVTRSPQTNLEFPMSQQLDTLVSALGGFDVVDLTVTLAEHLP
jgi:hypothetical protein